VSPGGEKRERGWCRALSSEGRQIHRVQGEWQQERRAERGRTGSGRGLRSTSMEESLVEMEKGGAVVACLEGWNLTSLDMPRKRNRTLWTGLVDVYEVCLHFDLVLVKGDARETLGSMGTVVFEESLVRLNYGYLVLAVEVEESQRREGSLDIVVAITVECLTGCRRHLAMPLQCELKLPTSTCWML
jgi:hypothetical protein